MNIMTSPHSGPASRIRRAAPVAAVVAVLVMLAGCSASHEDLAEFDTAAQYSGASGMLAESWDAPQQAVAEEAGSDLPLAADRSLIITGELYITVDDPIAAAKRAVTIVQDRGGRIDGRSETSPHDRHGGSAWLTLRIPSTDLDETVNDLRKLGTVDEYRTHSYDVTTEVTDLDAQISTLRASTSRIAALLNEATNISDIIKLEKELDQRQANLESLEAQQRGLNDQVSMSTIELSLTTEPVIVVDDSPRSFWDGLVTGWNGLVSFFTMTVVVIGIILPWVAVAAVLAAVVITAVRVAKRRKSRQPASAQAVTESAATEPTHVSVDTAATPGTHSESAD